MEKLISLQPSSLDNQISEVSSKIEQVLIMYYLREKRKLSLTENFSNVSFINTDITGVRFSDEARWIEETVREANDKGAACKLRRL